MSLLFVLGHLAEVCGLEFLNSPSRIMSTWICFVLLVITRSVARVQIVIIFKPNTKHTNHTKRTRKEDTHTTLNMPRQA
jgi:hypothetical protein